MTDLVDLAAPALDFASMRSAGKDRLSLALIDVRNRVLGFASRLEEMGGERALHLDDETIEARDRLDPVLWTLGHVAWFQEHAIARNVERGRGPAADASRPRLASTLADADARFDPARDAAARRAVARAGDAESLRGWLFETLETTLGLLDAVDEQGDAADDDALHAFRLALFHEEAQVERFAVLAQALGVDAAGLLARPPARAARPAIALPATRWLLGQDGPGFRFDDQQPPHPVAIPEFEIDAQAVSWAQFAEFALDGGYDEPAVWSDAGRDWLARTARRTPRHVEQMRHGVLLRRFGRTMRAPLGEAAVHVSAHEADAWCRWAGRRLPGEAEWEAAAHQGERRGFRVGEVCEWTATTYAPYPGAAGPAPPVPAGRRVQRGWSTATPAALHGRRLRRAAALDDDAGFAGFRSCAA